MRFADVLTLALSALYQQKARTLLTLFGVVIGTCILVLSISAGSGVYTATMRQFRHANQLRQIEISPGYPAGDADIPAAALQVHGPMSDAKRQRIRQMLVHDWRRTHPYLPKTPLTRQRLETVARLPHVSTVVPFMDRRCQARLGRHDHDVIAAAAAADNEGLRRRLVAGTYFSADDGRGVVVHEYLLYLWGIIGDEEVAAVVGKKLRLQYPVGGPARAPWLHLLPAGSLSPSTAEQKVLEKVLQRLQAAREQLGFTPGELATLNRMVRQLRPGPVPAPAQVFAEEFTIAGVVRGTTREDEEAMPAFGRWGAEEDVVLPIKTGEDFLLAHEPPSQVDISAATVTVDHEDNLQEVSDQVKGMGLRPWSLVEFVGRIRRNLILISFLMTFLAVVALLVSALGITNTMFMSVLERTHEIGVMKAVGARNRHIQGIFLVEGALIGAAGGALGLLCAWFASFPGDSFARTLMEKQTQTPLQETLFLFPLWLTLGAPVFAGLVTTLAAAYPARRAAKVNPITALRHE